MNMPSSGYNSVGSSESKTSSNFKNKWAKACVVCKETIEVGENATRGRKYGITHHRCADGVARPRLQKSESKPIGVGMPLGAGARARLKKSPSTNHSWKPKKYEFEARVGRKCVLCGTWINRGDRAVAGSQQGIAHPSCFYRRSDIVKRY
jgi:hypothetical protein